jgi:membrane-associated protein
VTALPVLLAGSEWLNPEKLLDAMGPWAFWGMLAIIFAECGLFALLPGDSLLFVAGIFLASGWNAAPNLLVTLVVLAIVAWLGNVNGYFIGYVVGPPLFKPDARVFKSEYAERAHVFFERFGARAIILARFVPIVRTFITLFAGVARMDRRQYLVYSAVGAAAWVTIVTMAGYWLGQIGWIKSNVDLIVLGLVALSLVPMAWHWYSERRAKRAA